MYFFNILLVLAIAYALLFILYSLGWRQLPKNPTAVIASTNQPIFFTIVIPARNEAHQIATTLTSILANDYPKSHLEIIVVDDFSTDNTKAVAEAVFTNLKFNNGRVLSLAEHVSTNDNIKSYKKKALEIAIQQSKGSHIITTDADCKVPPQWLATIASVYTRFPDKKIVIAPVNFQPATTKNWLYYFQSIDFMTMQGITGASYTMGMGSMCNGANLSFEKNAFMAVNGYEGIDQMASGDDMMLLHKIIRHFPKSSYYLKSTQVIVDTPVQATWKSFFNQRVRWASKNGKYNDYILNAILALVYLFNLGLLVACFVLFLYPEYAYFLLSIFAIKYLVEALFVLQIACFFGKKQECIYHLLLQPIHIFYIASAGFLGLFKQYEWKGRTINN